MLSVWCADWPPGENQVAPTGLRGYFRIVVLQIGRSYGADCGNVPTFTSTWIIVESRRDELSVALIPRENSQSSVGATYKAVHIDGIERLCCSFLWGQSPLSGFRLLADSEGEKGTKESLPVRQGRMNGVPSERLSLMNLRFRFGGIFRVLSALTTCVRFFGLFPVPISFRERNGRKKSFPSARGGRIV